MNVPGSNILRQALSVIARQQLQHFAFLGRITNEIGLDVASHAPATNVTGSLQPVARTLYTIMGLDLQANYYNLYIEKSVLDIRRDVSGDYFIYQGRVLQALSKTDWLAMDGWVAVLLVEINTDGSEFPIYVVDLGELYIVTPDNTSVIVEPQA